MFTKAFLFAVLVATQAYTAPQQPRTPAPAVNDGKKLVAMKSEDTPFGQLVYYGLAGGENVTRVDSDAAPKLDKRCGSNQVRCDGLNAVPNVDPCAALIFDGLQYNNNILPDWARAICLTSHGQCCISWAASTFNLPRAALFNAAATSFADCVVYGTSGLSADTYLNGVCTDQCLSSRPDGCP